MSLTSAEAPSGLKAAIIALGVAATVTAAVTVASLFVPDKYVATTVGFVFLAATWLLVWRGDDARVEASGLALGGIVLPGKLDLGRFARSVATSAAWAVLLGALFFVPFFFGWRWFWRPPGGFSFVFRTNEALNEVFGQLVIIALPEEAFYRGYLQSRLDEALPGFGSSRGASGELVPRRLRVFGAEIGPAILVTSVVFALGHLATIHDPARLAVFFPSLVFGWLRQRTGGVGAGIAFHASCNLFSELLGKGFHIY